MESEVQKKYPNDAKHTGGTKMTLPQDNHYIGRDVWEVRKVYTQFNVLMEFLNQVLELDRHTSVDQFSKRIRDLVYAANAPDENRIPSREELEDPKID